jgi:hypothetical protein
LFTLHRLPQCAVAPEPIPVIPEHSRRDARIRAFSTSEALNNAADPTQQTWNCMFGSLAQMRLQFAEGKVNRIEVG